MTDPEFLLEARAIGFRIGPDLVLENVSLRLHVGEILTVIGPNGAGKTTLLRLLIGLASPSTGSNAIRSDSPRWRRKSA